jgi:hypothetical protein
MEVKLDPRHILDMGLGVKFLINDLTCFVEIR